MEITHAPVRIDAGHTEGRERIFQNTGGDIVQVLLHASTEAPAAAEFPDSALLIYPGLYVGVTPGSGISYWARALRPDAVTALADVGADHLRPPGFNRHEEDSDMGLTQTEVDARIRVLVDAEALIGNTDRWPAAKLAIIQPDWDETDTAADDFIKNKPDIIAGAEPNVHLAGVGLSPNSPPLTNSEFVAYTDRAGATQIENASFQWSTVQRVKLYRYGSSGDPQDPHASQNDVDMDAFFKRMIKEGLTEVFIQRYRSSFVLDTTQDSTVILQPISYSDSVLDCYCYYVAGTLPTEDTPTFKLSFRLPARKYAIAGIKQALNIQVPTVPARAGAFTAALESKLDAAFDAAFSEAVDRTFSTTLVGATKGQALLTEPTGVSQDRQLSVDFEDSGGKNRISWLSNIVAGDWIFATKGANSLLFKVESANSTSDGLVRNFLYTNSNAVTVGSWPSDDTLTGAAKFYFSQDDLSELVKTDGSNVTDALREAIQGANETETLGNFTRVGAGLASGGDDRWSLGSGTITISVAAALGNASSHDSKLSRALKERAWVRIGTWEIAVNTLTARYLSQGRAQYQIENYDTVTGIAPALNSVSAMEIVGEDVHRGQLTSASFRDRLGSLSHQYLRTTGGAAPDVIVESPITTISSSTSEKKMATAGAVRKALNDLLPDIPAAGTKYLKSVNGVLQWADS